MKYRGLGTWFRGWMYLFCKQEVLSLNSNIHIKEKLHTATHACSPSIEDGGNRSSELALQPAYQEGKIFYLVRYLVSDKVS